MFYRNEPYKLTLEDQVLLNSMTESVFKSKRDVSDMHLPFIIQDNSPEFVDSIIESNDSHSRKIGLESDNFRENTSPFDTDVLGYYTYNNYTITLREKSIVAAARVLNVNADILRAIVLIHETAHHITQCPEIILWIEDWESYVKSDLDFWNNSTFMQEGSARNNHIASPEFLNCCSTLYIETVAQLFTYLVIKDLPDYLDVFEKLLSVQSANYTTFRKYIPRNEEWEVLRCMHYLRDSAYKSERNGGAPYFVRSEDLDHLLNK